MKIILASCLVDSSWPDKSSGSFQLRRLHYRGKNNHWFFINNSVLFLVMVFLFQDNQCSFTSQYIDIINLPAKYFDFPCFEYGSSQAVFLDDFQLNSGVKWWDRCFVYDPILIFLNSGYLFKRCSESQIRCWFWFTLRMDAAFTFAYPNIYYWYIQNLSSLPFWSYSWKFRGLSVADIQSTTAFKFNVHFKQIYWKNISKAF